MVKLEKITLSGTEKIGLISNLSTMLTAGISILEAVNSLLEDCKGNLKKVLETLVEDLSQGKHVYSSFSKFPRVFDKVTVNLIKASEEAGTLDVTLHDLKDSIRKEAEFSDKIKSALMYPMLIVTVFMGVLIMVLVVVIPKISIVFTRLRMKLPLPTRILIFVSNIVVTYTPLVIIAVIITVITLIFLYRTKKNALLGVLYSLPLISGLIKEIDLTRFSRSLYLLLSSGLPITSALDLVTDVVIKKKTAKIISFARDTVMSGKRLSEGLKTKDNYIPSIVVKLIEAGEKSGTLDKSMMDISEYLDYRVTNSLKTITVLMEPIMLVVVGIAVGGMMLAIIAPIYSLIGQVSPH